MNAFEEFRGAGNAIPQLDGDIEGIVRYFRELRGHDEVDDLLLGSSRFGTDKRLQLAADFRA